MRSSEEMAYVLYQAWQRHKGNVVDEIEWDDLTEWTRKGYLAEVDALIRYLFEHGRISAYLSIERLDELSKEYRAYLKAKNG